MPEKKTTTRFVLVLDGGLTWPGHGVLLRGDVVELPESGSESWAATRDRFGTSFLEDLSAPAQCQRWGQVFLSELSEAEAQQLLDAGTDHETLDGARWKPVSAPNLETVNGPRNLRLTPEGSVPIVTNLYGNGPVEIVPGGGR